MEYRKRWINGVIGMRIQIGHSRSFDFQNELYIPISTSIVLRKHSIILPHAIESKPVDTLHTIKDIDLFIAEISYPSTGLGIEIGFAICNNIPVIGIHRFGSVVSQSAIRFASKVFQYSNSEEFVSLIETEITKLDNI